MQVLHSLNQSEICTIKTIPSVSTINLQNIDLLPAFLQDSRCLYMNDTHWTAEGHQLVAKTLTQAILPLITE